MNVKSMIPWRMLILLIIAFFGGAVSMPMLQ